MIETDELACETLIVLKYNDTVIANLLGTPADIHELMIGHLACEGYLNTDMEFIMKSIFEVELSSKSFLAKISSEQKITNPEDSNRIVTSSCGACNNDDLEQLISDLPIIEKDMRAVDFDSLNRLFSSMRESQKGFQATGGMHAAGITDSDNNLLYVMEDIGRHNAVDKVIGKALKDNIDISKSQLLLSGRCGWDIVAKASRCGVPNIVSIGACSSLAAKAARYTGVRLISFLKPDNAVIIGHN